MDDTTINAMTGSLDQLEKSIVDASDEVKTAADKVFHERAPQFAAMLTAALLAPVAEFNIKEVLARIVDVSYLTGFIDGQKE